MAYRFTRPQRLLKTDEFSSVFSLRRSFSNDFFQLWFAPGQGDRARLGLVVPKKVVRQAVRRNRIKRLVREQFRLMAATLPPFDLVVRARRPFYRCEQAKARAALEALLNRLKSWRGS
jgi:ribonuclease P protein component